MLCLICYVSIRVLANTRSTLRERICADVDINLRCSPLVFLALPDVQCAANRLTFHVLDLVGDPGGLTLSVIIDLFFGEGVH